MNKHNTIRKKRVWFVAVIGILCCVVGGYVTLNLMNRKHEPPIPSREILRFGHDLVPMCSLSIIARHNGYFEAQGITLEATEYPSGQRAMTEGLFNDAIDLTEAGGEPVVFGSFTRNDFAVIATVSYSANQVKIVARKSAGIQEPKDLKGKRLATQKASSVHFFLHIFLTRHYINLEDISLTFMKAEDLPQALAAGAIDAFSMREPLISQAQELLGADAIIFSEPGLYDLPVFAVASRRMIAEKPHIVTAYLQALLLAETFSREHPEESKQIVAEKLGLTMEDIAAIWQDLDLRIALDQSVLPGLEERAKWALKNHLVTADHIPNYLDFIYFDGMTTVKPERLTIIR